MALYLINVQAHFVMNNIFEGLIWFFLPAALVIVNDIFAYICGVLFGRTQLIKLSPKKTVEGFVGAWVCTVIAAFGMTALLIRSTYFTCPVNVCLRLVSSIQLTCVGPRREYFHRLAVPTKSGFPSKDLSPSLPLLLPADIPPTITDLRPNIHTHAMVRSVRLPHRSFRWILRLRIEENVQD